MKLLSSHAKKGFDYEKIGFLEIWACVENLELNLIRYYASNQPRHKRIRLRKSKIPGNLGLP